MPINLCESYPMDQIIEMLENQDSENEEDFPKVSNIQSIIVLPPKDGDLTDVDSDEENDLNLNHLPSTMLKLDAEIVYKGSNEIKTEKKKVRDWKTTETFSNEAYVSYTSKSDETFDEMSMVETFESVFTSQIVNLLVDMSNKYAMQHNHSLGVTSEEMKVYIAVLLLTGYLSPKNIRMFWEVKRDVRNELVSSAIRRNRFLEIHQFLHTCDNFNLEENEKYAKIRNYFKILNESFLQNFELVFSTEILINEVMVPYYGKHGSKQHIHGKPIDFGYKLWSACTPSGYLIQFIPYEGSKESKLPQQENYGLGASVVLQLLSSLPKGKSYSLFFDNFFTSLPLLDKLTELGHFGTGPIKENRIEKCPIMSSKEMKKKGRGTMKMETASGLAIVRWNDNNIVTMASNIYGFHPISNVNRISSIEKKRAKIIVPCPKVVSMYNRFMGGVDRFDQNVYSQRISFRGKKWWFPLFAFGIDAACQNAWKVYQAKGNPKTTYCDFRRNIAQAYLGKFAAPTKKTPESGSPASSRVHPLVRKDNSLDHTQENCSQARCAHCHNRTRIKCKKCNVPLHIHCWYSFHNK